MTTQQVRLTFRPVAGGKLVCNQLPHLGRISSRRAESLRKQHYNKAVSAPKPQQPPVAKAQVPKPSAPPTILRAYAQKGYFGKQYGDTICPHCQSLERDAAKLQQPVRCSSCRLFFFAEIRPE
jgi:hypothetical protein